MEKEIIEVGEYKPVIGSNQVISQPDRLIEMALAKGSSMEQLEKLLDLKERYDKEEARKAFTLALTKFKSEELTIKKDKEVIIQPKDRSLPAYGYSHATLGNIVSIVVPLLAKHGISHRWETQQADARVKVTCVLTHKDGHSVSVSLDGSPDDSGKKNGIQQVASTITYLQRYTFLSITGLAVEEMDDDGQGADAAVEYITDDEALEIHSMITDNNIKIDIVNKWLLSKGIDSIDLIPSSSRKTVIKKIETSIKMSNKNDNT